MTQLRFHHLKIEVQDINGNIEMIPYCDINILDLSVIDMRRRFFVAWMKENEFCVFL
jgi:hypothetical protein